MKDLIFLMEPSKNEWITPLKIGYSYLNRLTIDEDAAFEVLGIHNLAPARYEISVDNVGTFEFSIPVDSELKQKGIEIHFLSIASLILSIILCESEKSDQALASTQQQATEIDP